MTNDPLAPAGAANAHVVAGLDAQPHPPLPIAAAAAGEPAQPAVPMALPLIEHPPAAPVGAAAQAPEAADGAPVAAANAAAHHAAVAQQVAEPPSPWRRAAAALARAGAHLAHGALAVGRALRVAGKVVMVVGKVVTGAVFGLLGGMPCGAASFARGIYHLNHDAPRALRLFTAALWTPLGAIGGLLIGPIVGMMHAVEADSLREVTLGAATAIWDDLEDPVPLQVPDLSPGPGTA